MRTKIKENEELQVKEEVSSSTSELSPTEKQDIILSEQSVIGAILNAAKNENKTLLNDIFNRVKHEDFLSTEHSTIFKAAHSLYKEQGVLPDTGVTGQMLVGQSKESDIPYFDYVHSIFRQSISENPENYQYHIERIQKIGSLKEVRLAAKHIEKLALTKSPDEINAVLAEAEESLSQIKRETSNELKPVSSILSAYIERLDEKYNSDIVGLPTGFEDLDNGMSPVEEGDLIIIAGRPSMGKTTFALNLISKMSVLSEEKYPSAIFSLEMSEMQIVDSLTAMLGRVNVGNIKTGNIESHEWAGINKAMMGLNEANLHIADTSNLTIETLTASIESMIEEHGIKIVLIDYLQLMSSDKKSNASRENQVSDISRGLKKIAKDNNIVVIALSQLSRQLESRPNKRPMMSDLRESGAIEQDADKIIFLYRDEVYSKDTPENKGLVEIILGKDRNGALDTIHMATALQYAQFLPLSSRVEHYDSAY